MGNKRPKYTVIKTADIDQLLEYFKQNPNLCDGIRAVRHAALPDAEVIRHQDITSAPIFHLYCSQILTLIELSKAQGLDLNYDELHTIADHFRQAAFAAEAHPHRKVPDL